MLYGHFCVLLLYMHMKMQVKVRVTTSILFNILGFNKVIQSIIREKWFIFNCYFYTNTIKQVILLLPKSHE